MIPEVKISDDSPGLPGMILEVFGAQLCKNKCSLCGAKHSPPALSGLVALRTEIPESKIIGDIESNNESFFEFFLSLG